MLKLSSRVVDSVRYYNDGTTLLWERRPGQGSVCTAITMSGVRVCSARLNSMKTLVATEYIPSLRRIAAIGESRSVLVTSEATPATDAATGGGAVAPAPQQQVGCQGLFMSNGSATSGDFVSVASRSPLSRLLHVGNYIVVANDEGSASFIQLSKVASTSATIAEEEDTNAAQQGGGGSPSIIGKLELDTLIDWCGYISPKTGDAYLFVLSRNATVSVVHITSAGPKRCGSCKGNNGAQVIRIGGRQPVLWTCAATEVSTLPFSEDSTGKITFPNPTAAPYALPSDDLERVVFATVLGQKLLVARSHMVGSAVVGPMNTFAVSTITHAPNTLLATDATLHSSLPVVTVGRFEGSWIGIGIDEQTQNPFACPLRQPKSSPSASAPRSDSSELIALTAAIDEAASNVTKYTTSADTLTIGISALLRAQDRLAVVAANSDVTIQRAHSTIQGPMSQAVVAFSRLRLWHFFQECGLQVSDLNTPIQMGEMKDKHAAATLNLKCLAHDTLNLSNSQAATSSSSSMPVSDLAVWPTCPTLLVESLLGRVVGLLTTEVPTLRAFIYNITSLTEDTVVAAIVLAALARLVRGDDVSALMPEVLECASPLIETAGFHQHLKSWACTIFLADVGLFLEDYESPECPLSAALTVEYDFGYRSIPNIFNALAAAPSHIQSAFIMLPAVLAQSGTHSGIDGCTGTRILLVAYLSGNAHLLAHAVRKSRGTSWRDWALEIAAKAAVDVRSASILGGLFDTSEGTTYHYEMDIVEKAIKRATTAESAEGDAILAELLTNHHRYSEALAVINASNLPNQALVTQSLAMLVGHPQSGSRTNTTAESN